MTQDWLRRLRGAIGMGLTWAVGWTLVGVLIGVFTRLLPGGPLDLFFEVFDAPLPALGIPGFVAGALFSTVLGIAGRHRRFDELSLPRFGAWGALGGLLLSLVPAALVAVGLGTPRSWLDLWQVTATFAPPVVLLSASSAVLTLALARKAGTRKPLDTGEGEGEGAEMAELDRLDREVSELLGKG